MISLTIALGGLALWAVIATIEVVARDGYGPIPVRSHHGFYASSLAA
ncbi:hypothetical protein [Microcella humidisoli]|uniref:Uncharacterized protein n=1 Tax=Microcella humidisoli TaxID=2963406 RepID=A0ABY5FZK7_9MICO|nr:hypothetical protein [Microcella humidisoli]UTT63347.1 hypothetical protein NNL39_04380 [Microcella humidisoli]